VRDDISINLNAVEDLERRFPDLEMLLIESSGDNLAATFSPELVDFTIYVIDVAGGEKIPREGGPAQTSSDLLLINKVDLADLVGASVEVMLEEARRLRSGRLVLPTDLRHQTGASDVARGWPTESPPEDGPLVRRDRTPRPGVERTGTLANTLSDRGQLAIEWLAVCSGRCPRGSDGASGVAEHVPVPGAQTARRADTARRIAGHAAPLGRPARR
jgi:hypothetical protein